MHQATVANYRYTVHYSRLYRKLELFFGIIKNYLTDDEFVINLQLNFLTNYSNTAALSLDRSNNYCIESVPASLSLLHLNQFKHNYADKIKMVLISDSIAQMLFIFVLIYNI